jgi:hypothetical protein
MSVTKKESVWSILRFEGSWLGTPLNQRSITSNRCFSLSFTNAPCTPE